MESKLVKWVLGHKITMYDTSADYDLMLAETPPQVPGPPPHVHKMLKESFLIIEGEMEFIVNGEMLVLKQGDSLDIPPNTLHTFSNNSNKICKWVNIHSPKGFRSFFDEMGILESEENAVEKSISPQVIEKIMATAADYDMIIKT